MAPASIAFSRRRSRIAVFRRQRRWRCTRRPGSLPDRELCKCVRWVWRLGWGWGSARWGFDFGNSRASTPARSCALTRRDCKLAIQYRRLMFHVISVCLPWFQRVPLQRSLSKSVPKFNASICSSTSRRQQTMLMWRPGDRFHRRNVIGIRLHGACGAVFIPHEQLVVISATSEVLSVGGPFQATDFLSMAL